MKGDVIIEKIKRGDVHIDVKPNGEWTEVRVVKTPKRNSKGQWVWTSKKRSGETVNYLVDPNDSNLELYNNKE